jgi:hypothetical protein
MGKTAKTVRTVTSTVFGRWPWWQSPLFRTLNDGTMKKGKLSLPHPIPFQPFPSILPSKLLVTDSLQDSNSNISEAKNA